MRTLMRTALVLTVAIAALSAQAQSNPNVIITPQAQPPNDLLTAKRIAREEAIKKVKANKAIFVDVRSAEQYKLAHIKGAINIPLSEVLQRTRELPPKKEIITYCA
jgi:3-mercaptopyruvate sulfurtransferase SseA